IGLSGSDPFGVEYKVGKSLFCNRFVRPHFDDLILQHDSVYSETVLLKPVINNDQFLYWGSTTMRVENSDLVEFLVAEYTHLRNDASSSILRKKYLNKCIVSKLISENKIMYISPVQANKFIDFPIKYMSDINEFKIDGFVVIYNVDPKFGNKDAQDDFLLLALKQIKAISHKAVVAASKCDTITQPMNISQMIVDKINLKDPKFHFWAPIVETSAISNVNIISAIQTLYSWDQKHKSINCRNYLETFLTVDRRTLAVVSRFSKILIFSHEKISRLTLDNLLTDEKYKSRTNDVINACGIKYTRKILNECKIQKIAKMKEKVIQYCLARFETCLVTVLNDPQIFEHDSNEIIFFVEFVKKEKLFDVWFEVYDISIYWEDIEFMESYIERMQKKNGSQPKIPLNILNNDRFGVLLDKHRVRLYSISQQQCLKNKLESTFSKLVGSNQLTINSTLTDTVKILQSIGESELAKCLESPLYRDVYTSYNRKLLLHAKHQLHELMFEHAKILSEIKL
ncbi:hypothetical protein MXB_3528, partial [Myxobolus squamalis]